MSPRSVVRYDWERELWNCPDVPGKYKGVLAALSFHATFDTGRDARPGNDLLVENSGLSESTVYRALKWGREHAWLWRAEHPAVQGMADVYWLTLPKHDHGHDLRDARRRAGCHTDTPPRDSHQGNLTKGSSPREPHQGALNWPGADPESPALGPATQTGPSWEPCTNRARCDRSPHRPGPNHSHGNNYHPTAAGL